MTHQESQCPHTEHVSPYALGELDAKTRRILEVHIDTCDACTRELASLGPGLEAFAEGLPEIAPPPQLWNRLRERIRGQASAAPKAPGRVHTPANQGGFLPTPFAGIYIRPLRIDKTKGKVTFELRCEPGARYPEHPHLHDEEFYVLEGDLTMGGQAMSAGDHNWVAAGAIHPAFKTGTGCLLLFHAKLEDHPGLEALAG